MGFLEERNLDGANTIPGFYKGKSVFITGGSGFMGKVLIEKLLYSCTDLDKIYLLLRCKKGVKPEDRLSAVYSSQCFDRLRNEKPDVFYTKVSVIAGDVMEPGLGLSEDDRILLINKVNIIFHVAASVRFDDTLKFAATMNLRGTNQVVNLAKEIRNLLSFVHVSTSYSNTNRATIEEVMYPPHANWRDILTICDNVDEHTLKVLTPKVLGQLPNTYTFTKQLAEHVVYEQRGKLPIVIYRPSIVISSMDEPVKGWIDNFNGPVALLVASGKGVMRSLYTDPDLKADYIPVDVSIKSMIVASWVRGTQPLQPTDDITIYNCCAGNVTAITMGQLIELGKEACEDMPLNDMLWVPGGNLTKSPTLHYFKVLLMHLLPAVLVDSILCALGRKPMLVKVQRRIYTANLALLYYITQQWTFDNKNFLSLRSSVKEEDQESFSYQIENVDVKMFFQNAFVGARKYLLKEKDEDLPRARRHYKRMKILNMVVQILFYGLIFWWFIKLDVVQNVCTCLTNIVF